MALTNKTPGVYINELNAFPNSVVPVATALPVFIGYTQSNSYKGVSLKNKPTPIASLADYVTFFCGGQQPTACNTMLAIDKATTSSTNPIGDVTLNGVGYLVTPQASTFFYMYNSVQLFFQNGGGTCYIMSVGMYDKEGANGPSISDFNALSTEGTVFDVLAGVQEPTLILIPDALLFNEADYYTLMNASLNHCGDVQSRMTLMDAYGGNTVTDPLVFESFSKQKDAKGNTLDPVGQLRGNVTSQFLNYGAAYYPFVNTSIANINQINFTNIVGGFTATYAEPALASTIATIISGATTPALVTAAHNKLLNISYNYAALMQVMLAKINCLPVTPAVAGCIAVVDGSKGVWMAPANISLNAVQSPVLNINDDMQSGMNVDAVAGKSVNAIRPFTGFGVMIWGARTLDGNSQDWRYISVRRTLIMIEQSIKLAAGAYVFAPNDANTWLNVQSMIANFLSGLWSQGALAGAKPSDAFSVSVGLGSTMTAQDILDGYMVVAVLVAVTHPAEFIEITFKQEMQTS